MDITPSPAFCAACRIVLGGDTPNIVLPALRTAIGHEIRRIHGEILNGKRAIQLPLDPPAGAMRPDPLMALTLQQTAERGAKRRRRGND